MLHESELRLRNIESGDFISWKSPHTNKTIVFKYKGLDVTMGVLYMEGRLVNDSEKRTYEDNGKRSVIKLNDDQTKLVTTEAELPDSLKGKGSSGPSSVGSS